MASTMLTPTTARVMKTFLGEPDRRRYGFELMQLTGLASGSLYPILARLERIGWINGAKETIDPKQEGRPPRRYYVLTGEGAREARVQLAELSEQLRPPGVPHRGFPRPGVARSRR
jgi:PadR family transcriptional regulator, regulatory protein PadR